MTDINNDDSISDKAQSLRSATPTKRPNVKDSSSLNSSFKLNKKINSNKLVNRTSTKNGKFSLKPSFFGLKETNNTLADQIEKLGFALSRIQGKKLNEEEKLNGNTSNKNKINNIYSDKYALKLINTLSDIEHEKNLDIIEIVCYILKKSRKKDIETLILKTHFFRYEKLMSLFTSLNVNIHDMMNKLVSHIKYERKYKGNVLFKEGDRGDKLYIIIKGEVGVLVHQEKKENCSNIEYLKYLITLYLFQENSLITKIILANKENIKLEERCFFTLLLIFKFYHFYKESKYSKYIKNILEFIKKEKQIKDYIKKKQDYLPSDAINILNLNINNINDLFLFYLKTIDEINNYFQDLNITSEKKLQHQQKSSRKNNVFPLNNNFVNFSNINEFLSFIDLFEDYSKENKTEEFFDKVYGVYEISPYLIYESDIKNYIQRTDYNTIMEKIRKETANKQKLLHFTETSYSIKCYNYVEVNQMSTGNIFGELALINPNKKRTATIIMKEDCDFGTLIKQYYDLSIKAAQDKIRTKDVLFFTEGPIFKGISYNNFHLNYLFRFKKKCYINGEYIFLKDQPRDKIYFIINGECQLSGNMTLKELSENIEKIVTEKTKKNKENKENIEIDKLIKKDVKFKQIYENKKLNIKFCVLKDKEIMGLDDLSLNNLYLFDCKCVSQKVEIYELNFNVFQKALEDKSIRKNYEKYLKLKKNFFIDRLLTQRKSVAKNEYYKIQLITISNIQKIENPLSKKISLNDYKSKKDNRFLYHNSKINIDNKKISIFGDIKMHSTDNSNNINNSSSYYNTSSFFYNNTFYNKSNSHNKKNITKIKQYKKKLLTPLNELTKLRSSSKKYSSIINIKNIKVVQNFNSFVPQNYQSSTHYNCSLKPKIKTNDNNFQPLQQKTFDCRIRKKIIPYFMKGKIKNKTKWIMKDVSPILLKEVSQKITETRSYVQKKDFYMENQEIFNSLINNSPKNFYKACNVSYRNKCFTTDSSSKNSFNDIEINKQNIEFNDNLKNRNDYNRRNALLQKIGIIDCLCLDKWEEKKRESITNKKSPKSYWFSKKL